MDLCRLGCAMHNVALVAQDAQNAETLKTIFTKMDRIIGAIRASNARQQKWNEIVQELKVEKALDKNCPSQLIQV